jgi:hypothetical protein
MAIVCEDHPGNQIPRKGLLRYSGRSAGLWMSSLKRGSPPDWSLHIRIRENSLHHQETSDSLDARVTSPVAWETSKIKILGLDAFPTYKRVED